MVRCVRYDFHLATAKAEPRDAPPITLTLTFAESSANEWPASVVGTFSRAKVLQVHPDTELQHVILRVTAFIDPASGSPQFERAFLDFAGNAPVGAIRRLVRGPDGIKAHRIDVEAFDDAQLRQFEFHVRYSRGELLLARCWLLVEGETEVRLLPAVARRLNTPLERFGIRCVPYRQADLDLYLELAKQLGIRWCLFCDTDKQGKMDSAKAKAALGATVEADVIFPMPAGAIEEYLATNGFIDVYEERIAEPKKGTITAATGTADYVAQVINAMSSRAGVKTSAAVEVATRIEAGASIPPLLQAVVEAAVKLGRMTAFADVDIRALPEVSIRLKELPPFQLSLPSEYTVGFSIFGFELFAFTFTGDLNVRSSG
jgi:hypothetical protein